MTEHLFKLKKDGKCVGYMRLKESPRGLEWRYFDKDDSRESLIRHSIFDTAYPFVCKDKNGKGVFAGDKVKGTVETIFEDAHPVEGYIDYMSDICGWSLDMPDFGIFVCLEIIEDIELIEDKGNDTNKT